MARSDLTEEQVEKKGMELSASGFTMDNLDDLLDMPLMCGEA